MDHAYIDQNSVPDRYLRHALPVRERAAFEAHLVDCQECTDRVLLAEMFQNRNGAPGRSVAGQIVETPRKVSDLPLRARFVAALTPWQLFLILAIAAILLLAIPCAFFIWELRRLRA